MLARSYSVAGIRSSGAKGERVVSYQLSRSRSLLRCPAAPQSEKS
jgi:hypothetical protein